MKNFSNYIKTNSERFLNELFVLLKIPSISALKENNSDTRLAAELIKKSKKPIIIAGGGIFYSDATGELSDFAKKHNIPVTQTIMGYSSMEKDHSHYTGTIGGLGGKAANNLSKETELLSELVKESENTYEYRVEITPELINEVISYGPSVTVLGPKSLIKRVVEVHKEALKNY